MTYHSVVDRFSFPVPLDPLSAVLFTALFLGVAYLTARRPAYGLCALVLAIPIAYSHDLLRTTVTAPKAALLGVALGLTAYRGCAQTLRRRPAPLLLWALGIYALATALSIAGSSHCSATIRETLKAVEYGVLFVVAYLCYALDPDDAAILVAASVAAILVAVSALGQELFGAPSGLFIGPAIVPRIAGLLEGPNQLAAYFDVAAATLGAWALARRSALLGAALGLAVCADVLTFSRAGLFGLLVVAGTIVAAGGKPALRALRPGLIGLIAGLAGAAGWAIYAHTPGVMRVSFEPSVYAGGVGNRRELWSAAWRMWLSHPIFGIGAGNFELLLPRYGVYGVRTHANSWYLQSLAEGGIVLFAATIALVAAVLATFSRGFSLARLRAASPWVVAALAASLALALHQTVDYLVFYTKVGDAWWLLLGIGAAALRSDA